MKNLLNFDRERTPERVVHATGASAKGFFEVTLDVSHPTCADFLRAPGVQTPVIVRFLTVIHERGSPETLVVLPPSFTQGRQISSILMCYKIIFPYCLKFYDIKDNFDMVGNNFPVFFIRDGIKFPDMVHSLKPNPKIHIPEN
ncbi:Catalase isozyme 1 [Nymphaea thermarum]|nr:Catalase isozyme 1 [Nymphaea thermarum]